MRLSQASLLALGYSALSSVLSATTITAAPINNTQITPPETTTQSQTLCIASYTTWLNFTNPYDTPLSINISLAGGGGGGGSLAGAGGGGGSSAISIALNDVVVTRHYAAGGQGGDADKAKNSPDQNGQKGQRTFADNVQVPVGGQVLVIVGGGGGGGNGNYFLFPGTGEPANVFAGGGGGAGASGGGGGASNAAKTSNRGGGGGEAKGALQPGAGYGDATYGSTEQKCGGMGGEVDQYDASVRFGGYGGCANYAGGSGPSAQGYMGGGGGGFGSGGGRGYSGSPPTSAGFGGGFGSSSSDGHGLGATTFPAPTTSGSLPASAGLGGLGTQCNDCQDVFGGNAGYAVIAYYSPTGECLIPKQA